jgi:hypothetical protein
MTGSMRPALRGGEFCWAEIPSPKTIWKIGDIVDTGKVTHRITAMNERAILTSGDANKFNDGWTLKKDVRFILRFVQRP